MAKATPAREQSATKKAAAPVATVRKKAESGAMSPKKAAAKKAEVKKPIAAGAPAKATPPKKAASSTVAPKKVAPAKGAAQRPAPAKAPAKKSATRQPVPANKTAAGKTASTPILPEKKAAARTASSKSVAVKTAVPRRPAVRVAAPVPAARRGRATAAPRKAAPPTRVSSKPGQVFTVSHLNQADFKADGLRSYAQYRDLGIAAATGGLCQAHVIRFVPPCTDDVRKRHVHQVDLQLVYVLNGWIKNEFEGYGEQMMSAGSCWLQPSGIKHTVLDYSPDCEVLEIIVPADFKTDDLS